MIMTKWNPPLKTTTKFVPWMKILLSSRVSFHLGFVIQIVSTKNRCDDSSSKPSPSSSKGFPIETSHSSLLTPSKGPQTIISTILVDFFYILNLSTITFGTKMRGAINKKEVEKLAREQ
jgi:hypothetical protein